MNTPTAQAAPPLGGTSMTTKTTLRAELRARRSNEARQMPKAAEALAYRFPDALLKPELGPVSGYAPIRDEIEPGGVMSRLRMAEAKLCLPVVKGKDEPLIFRAWTFGDPLEKDVFGIYAPGEHAAEVTPRMLLIPLLGFSPEGGRLGYGAGHYDRTLKALRAQGEVIAIGLAFEVQRVWDLPLEPHDERLDWVVTESAAYQIR